MKFKILSLYDGMSCGYLAMQAAGVSVGKYDAFEIDKYAIQTSKHNFPDIEHHGDVTGADFSQFRGYDYLIGGSPCTYWSIAQSPDKRETTASGLGWELFSHYVRALKEAQPRYFIYENNYSMAKAIRESITDAFGFEPIMINSALVSAQNRKRLYWVGIRNERGEYERADIEQPQDKGIILKNILENGSDALNDKSYCITATEYKDSSLVHSLQKHVRTRVAEPFKYPLESVTENEAGVIGRVEMGKGNHDQIKRVYSPNGKAPTLTTCTGGHREPKTLDNIQPGTTAVPNVYEVKGGQITVKGKQYPIKLKDGFYIIRKLTVTECKRLQTVPDDYEFPVSNAQAYKMLGNGWTVEVIAHLIRATQSGETAGAQLSLI